VSGISLKGNAKFAEKSLRALRDSPAFFRVLSALCHTIPQPGKFN
jgi:hypothetical protein